MDRLERLKADALDAGLLLLRVAAGLGMAFAHGYGKVFGGNMDRFAQGVGEMGFPAPLAFAWMAALSEFAGGLLVAAGLGTRAAAFLMGSTMAVAAFIRHAADPFQRKELAFVYLAVSLALVLTGPGRWSLDALFAARRRRR